jgi:hypothetical protein
VIAALNVKIVSSKILRGVPYASGLGAPNDFAVQLFGDGAGYLFLNCENVVEPAINRPRPEITTASSVW